MVTDAEKKRVRKQDSCLARGSPVKVLRKRKRGRKVGKKGRRVNLSCLGKKTDRREIGGEKRCLERRKKPSWLKKKKKWISRLCFLPLVFPPCI